MLCTEGTAVLASADGEVALDKGQSVFVPAGAPLSARGPAVLYRATTNLDPVTPARTRTSSGRTVEAARATCWRYLDVGTSPAEASACSLSPAPDTPSPLVGRADLERHDRQHDTR